MDRAAIFIAFSLQVSVCRAIACQSPYQDILGVCLYFDHVKLTWCNAQAYCSKFDGELVRGKNYLPLAGKNFLKSPEHYWIGLTDFKHERGENKSGWRWTDGSVVPPSSELVWMNFQPSHAEQDCVAVCTGTTKGELCDENCNQNFHPMCQPRPRPSSVRQVRGFKPVTIPTNFLSRDSYAENVGCLKHVSLNVTKLDCAVLCRDEAKGWCVSFYFHVTTEKCRLVLYTDINLKTSGVGWIKLVVDN